MKSKTSKATLCEVSGHSWQTTASDKVKVCSRGSCRQIAQLVNGHWTYKQKVMRRVKGENLAIEALEVANVNAVKLWGEE